MLHLPSATINLRARYFSLTNTRLHVAPQYAENPLCAAFPKFRTIATLTTEKPALAKMPRRKP